MTPYTLLVVALLCLASHVTDAQKCTPNPCTNGGYCQESATSYTCVCKPGWKGTRCDTKLTACASAPCLNGGTCSETGDGIGFRCKCGTIFSNSRCEDDWLYLVIILAIVAFLLLIILIAVYVSCVRLRKADEKHEKNSQVAEVPPKPYEEPAPYTAPPPYDGQKLNTHYLSVQS